MGGVLQDDGAITIDSSRFEGCLVSGASRVGAVESSMGFLASASSGVCAAELPTRGRKNNAGRGLQGAAIAFARRLEKCSLGKRSNRHPHMSAIEERFVWAKKRRKERNIGCLLWGMQDVAGSIHFSKFHGRGSTRGALPCVRC